MSVKNGSTTGERNPAMWPKLSDQDWVALHVPRFQKIQPCYQQYEEFLEGVLKEVCRQLAPLAIVNARVKSLVSFAEKILRKRALYVDPKDPQPPDPLARMTDLCGGRVITQTADEVGAVCAWIKQAFDIDWANSEDASQRLKPTEFGYRSVHYIVIVNPEKLAAAGVTTPVPSTIKGLKAEVQVRTLLEHASAGIGHDILYKAAIKVPDVIKRQFAALAAVLEGADREFGRVLAALNDFRSNFGAWHKPDDVKREMERLRIVLRCDPANEGLATRIGQLALTIGEHRAALDVLRRFGDSRQSGVRRVRGMALTEMHWEESGAKEFAAGMDLLEAASQQCPRDSETLTALAECWAHRGDDERAGALFRKAIVVDPSEPLSFCRFLEFEVARQRNDAMVRLTEPMIHRAMDRCRREIQAGVNLPNASSCLAVFQLLIAQPYPALDSLTQVLSLCGKPTGGVTTSSQPCAAGRALRRLRETLCHLHCIREKLEGFDWFERLLKLALAVLVKDEPAQQEVRRLASWGTGEPHIPSQDLVVILSGGCAPQVQGAVQAFRRCLREAVEGLPLTLLSGGTRIGISGLAGYLAVHSQGRIRAYGYLPSRLPVGVQPDRERFAALFESPGSDFTPLDPLQGWTDLIAAGVQPRRVKLISFAAGHISRVEYAVALALGARVGVIDDPVVPKERRFHDPLWADHPNLIRLPMDAMTVRAFLQLDALELTAADQRRLRKAAHMAHEDYVKSATPRDPSLQPWDKLDESLKRSNYFQVAYWERALRNYGLALRRLRPEDKKHRALNITKVVGPAGILRLAATEHGRWNVERLSYGWRFSEQKDVAQRLSPYLIPWRRVPKRIQKYDIDAVRGLPERFRKAGLELYRCLESR